MIARQVFVFLVALALASTTYSASVSLLQPALQKRGLTGMQRLTPKDINGLAADHPLPRHEDEAVDKNATFSSGSLRGRDRSLKAHSSRHNSGMAKIKRVTRPESNEDYDKRNSQRNGNGQYGSHHQGNGQQSHSGKGSSDKGSSGNKESTGNKGSSGGSGSSGDGGKNGDDNQEGDQDQSGGSGATGPQGQWSGDATFFEQKGTGAGACSGIVSQDTDKIAALSAKFFQNYGKDKACKKYIKATYNGKSVIARVTDECPECAEGSVDFSKGAFDLLGTQNEGRLKGMTWSFVDGPDDGSSSSSSSSSSQTSSASTGGKRPKQSQSSSDQSDD